LKDSINGRVKGAEYERQFCKWLNNNLGIKAKRNLDQVRDSGSDVITEWFMFECKREEVIRLDDYWYQVMISSKKHESKMIPVVVFKQSHRKQEFLIPASLIPGIEFSFIRLSEKVFVKFSDKVINDRQEFNKCIRTIYKL
jgi:hypothetical protein